jgi:hypothetical protein
MQHTLAALFAVCTFSSIAQAQNLLAIHSAGPEQAF